MKKNKLKCIEAYIYAKTLNLITNNTPINGQSKSVVDTVNSANLLSKNLLNKCEEKLKILNLYNNSFLVLKKELENVEIYKNASIINYSKICEMIKDYDVHLKAVM